MRCAKCQAPITKDTRFCAGCGDALPWTKAAGAGPRAAVLSDALDLEELARLNGEKRRLSQQLEALLEVSQTRGASTDEQAQYKMLRAEWQRIAETITEKMQVMAARQSGSRRQSDVRMTERRQLDGAAEPDRRTGEERRDTDRRTVSRRNPFPPAV